MKNSKSNAKAKTAPVVTAPVVTIVKAKTGQRIKATAPVANAAPVANVQVAAPVATAPVADTVNTHSGKVTNVGMFNEVNFLRFDSQVAAPNADGCQMWLGAKRNCAGKSGQR